MLNNGAFVANTEEADLSRIIVDYPNRVIIIKGGLHLYSRTGFEPFYFNNEPVYVIGTDEVFQSNTPGFRADFYTQKSLERRSVLRELEGDIRVLMHLLNTGEIPHEYKWLGGLTNEKFARYVIKHLEGHILITNSLKEWLERNDPSALNLTDIEFLDYFLTSNLSDLISSDYGNRLPVVILLDELRT